MLTASVRQDLRDKDLLISVEIDHDTNEWVTFTNRPAQVLSETEDHRYQVLLEDGRVVTADSIDLEFEGAN